MSPPTAARPLILLAHGAGAPSRSPWMQSWARRLGEVGEVVPFDYPYMQAGRKTPDKPSTLIAAHRSALTDALGGDDPTGDRPVVLAGKSMGSRIGCHVAVELARAGRPVGALVCFGYPLRAASSGALRDEVLRQLETPILFVQGTRDPLCKLEQLAEVRTRMQAPTELFVVQEGDHSLLLPRRRGAGAPAGAEVQEASDRRVLEAVKRFVASALSGGAGTAA